MSAGRTLTLLFIVLSLHGFAQGPLSRTVSLDVNRQRLDNVLEIISNKGNFYFSYQGNIFRTDSAVTLSVNNKTVKQVLETLLPGNYEFRESGNYVIIRRAPITLTLVTSKASTQEKAYVISGYVLNDFTGEHIHNASVYEKQLLASTLTNQDGYFKLALKQKKGMAALTVSKQFYQDTTVFVDPGYNQQITVTIVPATQGAVTIISPEDYFAPDQLKVRVQKDSTVTEYTYVKTDSSQVEQTAIGKFLLSSRQRIQGMNLRRFFTSRPFQFSLTPGLGTHGKLSGQVINNFSLNVFGGYNGGVDGVEIGGLFNINKKYARYVQLAGIFNLNGGRTTGVQVAGITNTVLDSVRGVQVAGINNFAKGNMFGLQVGGISNITTREMNGVQIGGIFNYAGNMKGVQVGLINVCDSSDGIGIGLINIVMKGYHKLSFYTDELVMLNAAFKTGNNHLYNILQAGFNPVDNEKLFTFGYGLGAEYRLGRTFSLNPEFTGQYLYLGSWDYANILSKAHLNLNIKLGKYVSLFAGPAYNVYYSKQDFMLPGYKTPAPPPGYKVHDLGTNVKGWLGWSAGINFF